MSEAAETPPSREQLLIDLHVLSAVPRKDATDRAYIDHLLDQLNSYGPMEVADGPVHEPVRPP